MPMKSIVALLRRYHVTLFLICIAVLATTTIAQGVRLRYLEERHQQMFRDFGKYQFDVQDRMSQLAARCPPPPARD